MSLHVRFRGFDRGEVIAALAKLRSENEDACHEVERLGDRVDQLQEALRDMQENEGDAQRALITAHRAADEIRSQAEQEAMRIVAVANEGRSRAEQQASLIVEEAGRRSELLLQEVRGRALDVERQIEVLMTRRSEAAARLEAFLNDLAKTVDSVWETERSERRNSSDNDLPTALSARSGSPPLKAPSPSGAPSTRWQHSGAAKS